MWVTWLRVTTPRPLNHCHLLRLPVDHLTALAEAGGSLTPLGPFSPRRPTAARLGGRAWLERMTKYQETSTSPRRNGGIPQRNPSTGVLTCLHRPRPGANRPEPAKSFLIGTQSPPYLYPIIFSYGISLAHGNRDVQHDHIDTKNKDQRKLATLAPIPIPVRRIAQLETAQQVQPFLKSGSWHT